MLTVVLGLGSALGYVLHDYLMVKVVRAVAVWTAMTWSMGAGMIILVPLALILHGPPGGAAQWRAVAFAVAGGLCEAAAVACLLRGLVSGNLSIVTPLASLAGGIVAVVAVAGGLLASLERAPAEEVFGLESRAADGSDGAADDGDPPAALPAGAAAAQPRRRRGTAGAGWALLSSLLFAVVILLLDEATALPPVSMAAWRRVGTMVVLVPVALLLRGWRLPRAYLRRCAFAGAGDAAGFILFAAAIVVGPLAVASVVIAQGGTTAVLVGYVALRERLSKVQYAGVACTIAACTLFALS